MLNKERLIMLLGATAIAGLLTNSEANAQSAQDLQIQINAMKQQLESLQKQLDAVQVEKAKEDPGIEVKWEPAPSIRSADGRFEMNLRGRVFADAAWISDADDNFNTKATEFRAARLGIEGKAWEDIN